MFYRNLIFVLFFSIFLSCSDDLYVEPALKIPTINIEINNFEEINYNVGSNKISEYECEHIINLPTHNQIKPYKLRRLLLELKNSGDIITKDKVI